MSGLVAAPARLAVGWALLAGAVACAPETRERDDLEGGAASVAPSDSTFDAEAYERAVAFLTTAADTPVAVAWLLDASTTPGAVRRTVQGMAARGGAWERFFYDTWETPPVAEPWQILPRGPVRLIVGEGDALERLVFEEGARQLQTVLGSPLVEWIGARNERFRLLEGSTLLAGAATEGLVLDVSRASRVRPDASPGDWGLLVSGDSLQVVVHEPRRSPEGDGGFRAWARLDFRTLQWPLVHAQWSDTLTFDPARREVPAGWRMRADPGLEIDVEVAGSEMAAGPGEGPQLPLEAVMLVEGTVRVEGGEYPVIGLFRHVQR